MCQISIRDMLESERERRAYKLNLWPSEKREKNLREKEDVQRCFPNQMLKSLSTNFELLFSP